MHKACYVCGNYILSVKVKNPFFFEVTLPVGESILPHVSRRDFRVALGVGIFAVLSRKG